MYCVILIELQNEEETEYCQCNKMKKFIKFEKKTYFKMKNRDSKTYGTIPKISYTEN